MEEFITFIQTNIQYAHWMIFGVLLLAGLNIPVSEDLMIFTAAVLAKKNPEYLPELFLGVYAGAFFSDLICYTLGRKLGHKLWEIKWFAKMVSKKKVDTIHEFYEKYGIITLLVGRFFPFGVRNALFLTAGIGKMNFIKFALSDLLACTISTIVFFYLYHRFGVEMIDYVKQGNAILFSAGAVAIGLYFLWKRRRKSLKS